METVSEYIYNDYETEDVELYAEQMIRDRKERDEKRREQIEKALAKAERTRKRVENRRRKTEVYKDKPYPREVQIPGIG